MIALDKSGRPVTDLKLEELRLFEDKVEQPIKSLSPAANEPLTIGLFFDVSGSRRADLHVNEETRLTSEFVHSIWHQGNTAFLLVFNWRAIVITEPTRMPEEVDQGLKQVLGGNWGSTALYDALCYMKPEKLTGIPGRKVYVVFSDFNDNASRNKADRVLEVAREAGVAIFPMFLSEEFAGDQSKKQEKRSREQAQKFALETGGEVLAPRSQKELAIIFQRLTADLQSAYRIGGYLPSSPSSREKSRRGRLKLQTTRAGVELLYPKR